LDTGEVTNHEWQIYLDATGQKPSKDLTDLSWKDGKIPDRMEDHPVVGISHREAEDYAKWALKRLPTEEEWEYAARGPTGFRYPWGDEFDPTKAHCASSKMVGGRSAQKSCVLPEGKSPFGLLDMAGNVWEWTSSPYVAYEDYKDIMVATRYTKGKLAKYSAAELFSNKRRVIRGGAWNTPKIALLSALRQGAEINEWNTTLGFRCAKSAQAGAEALDLAMKQVRKDLELDLGSALAREITTYDADKAVTSHRAIAFAPVKTWEKLADVQRRSLRDPVAVGLIYTTEEIVVPKLAPGSYWVAYQAGDEKARIPKGASFPEEGWVYQGWEENDPSAATAAAAKKEKPASKKSSSKKKAGKKDEAEPAEGEAGEGDAGEGESGEGEPGEGEPGEGEKQDEAVRYEASEGSVIYNFHKDNLLLVDSRNRVLAALPLEEVKDGARPGPAQLTIQKVGEDKRGKLPATERRNYAFTITVPGKKGVAFELPLRFQQGALEAKAASTSKAGGG
ncbi:MAG: SUMF1/EgtB/PvdO family nonheme iron enzyme, partial [Planctomycetota bacterium]